MIVGVDWHSYSQLILRPYGKTYIYTSKSKASYLGLLVAGWSTRVPPDEEQLSAVGEAMSRAIFAVSQLWLSLHGTL